MKYLTLILAFYCSITLNAHGLNELKKCVIKGEVFDRPDQAFLLIKSGDDPRSDKSIIIPVLDGKFSYAMEFEHEMVYNLIGEEEFKKGAYRPIKFFLEEGEIVIRIYPSENYSRNQVIAGPLNKALSQAELRFSEKYEKFLSSNNIEIRSLMDENRFHSEKMKALIERLQGTEDPAEKNEIFKQFEKLRENDEDKSPEAYNLVQKQREISKSIIKEKYDEMINSPSLIGYHYLVSDLYSVDYRKELEGIDFPQIQTLFAAKFPDHPYTQESESLILGKFSLKAGSQYIDFTLPDLDGKMRTLSGEIKGKIALIDLWAPWCGPCIQKSREMKPIYDKYKDRGFTVVGVLGQFKSREQALDRLGKEAHPWLTLIEEGVKESIWLPYGIANSGGKTFLVDEKGLLVAFDPSKDELMEFLENSITR